MRAIPKGSLPSKRQSTATLLLLRLSHEERIGRAAIHQPCTTTLPPPPTPNATPPPPPLVRATVGVVAATLGTVGFGGSLLWLSMKTKGFVSFGTGDGGRGMLTAVLPPTLPPSCPLEVETAVSPDDSHIDDATIAAFVSPQHAQTPPLSEQHSLLLSSDLGI